ncbi:MAG: YicC/YloC family endoribonuclease [Pseudomonadota bacterium]
MTQSMTAYATQSGSMGEFSWVWELRSVNGKGLDLRVRVPDWIEGLEPALRAAVTGAVTRGNTQASLRVTRVAGQGGALSQAALATVMAQIKEIEAAAQDATLPLAPATAVDILGLRALHDAAGQDDGGPELAAAVKADIAPLVTSFVEMRAAEGAALQSVILAQLASVAALVEDAAALLPDRAQAQEEAFRAGLARVLKEVELDEARLAQELALLAIKSDVTEEIDRLRAHVTAARDLIAADGPVGRKFDFLMQEFNREANTLCSKSTDSALTALGLDLKVAIDQMREQIQNVE